MIRYNGIVIDRKKLSITHRGATWRVQQRYRGDSHVFRSLAMLILGEGVSAEQLFFHIYGKQEDGGPLQGPHVFHVRFSMWKPIYKQLQLELRKVKTAGVNYYCLVPKLQFEQANVA